MTDPTKKLIWRGNPPRCRSLAVKGPKGAPVFYAIGEEVPAGALTQEVENDLVERGMLDRIETKIAPVVSAPPSQPALISYPKPIVQKPTATVQVDVGVMRAEVKPGPDKIFGTPDDVVSIRPKGTHSIADPSAVEETSKPVDEKPKISPVRKRKGTKKTKSTKKATKK